VAGWSRGLVGEPQDGLLVSGRAIRRGAAAIHEMQPADPEDELGVAAVAGGIMVKGSHGAIV